MNASNFLKCAEHNVVLLVLSENASENVQGLLTHDGKLWLVGEEPFFTYDIRTVGYFADQSPRIVIELFSYDQVERQERNLADVAYANDLRGLSDGPDW